MTRKSRKYVQLLLTSGNLLLALVNLVLYLLFGKWWSVAVMVINLAAAVFCFYVYLKLRLLDA